MGFSKLILIHEFEAYVKVSFSSKSTNYFYILKTPGFTIPCIKIVNPHETDFP
jgi:hypothetical protein